MRANFAEALKAVLKHEGGYVNNPSDPGGMTNLGCTKRVWEEHCGYEVTETIMRKLTPADVAPLYKTKYWDKIRGDDLPSGIDYIVFDAAINSGPGRAAKWLQQAVNVKDDGAIGPGTLKAVQALSTIDLIKSYQAKRLAFMQALSTWPTFGKGWQRRVDEVTSSALAIASGGDRLQ